MSEATHRTVSRASSSAASSSARTEASSICRGARDQPPTRTLTGWIGRASEERDELVAELLQAQSARDDLRVVGGQLDGARIPEKVGRMQQVDVECVALDPLAAVEETPQRAHLRVDLDVEQGLEGVDRGHLIRHRADPADAGHDVDDLVGGPADDEPLEVAWRLEDLEVCARHRTVADGELQAPLALDPGQLPNGEARHILGLAAAIGPQLDLMHRRSPRWIVAHARLAAGRGATRP